MTGLPRIGDTGPPVGIVLNWGPRHTVNRAFSAQHAGRFFSDNSMRKHTRQEELDARSKERARLRKLAQEEKKRKREAQLLAIEKNMGKEETKLARLVRQSVAGTALPPIVKESSPKLKESGLASPQEIGERNDEVQKCRDRQDVAARRIQTWVRARNRKILEEKRQREQQARAAVYIQRRTRERHEQSKAQRKSWLRCIFIEFSSAIKFVKTERIRYTMATKIQCRFRIRQAHSECHRQQRLWSLLRKRLQRRVCALRRARQIRKNAAIQLQTKTRGYQTRQQIQVQRKSISILQSAFRRRAAFKYTQDRRCAAHKICAWTQPRVRGAAGRRYAKRQKQYWAKRFRLRELSVEQISDVILHPLSITQAYKEAWSRLGVDGALLSDPHLSDQDLEQLEVSLRVHRRRVLQVLKDIRRDGILKHTVKKLKEAAARQAAIDKAAAAKAAVNAAAQQVNRRSSLSPGKAAQKKSASTKRSQKQRSKPLISTSSQKTKSIPDPAPTTKQQSQTYTRSKKVKDKKTTTQNIKSNQSSSPIQPQRSHTVSFTSDGAESPSTSSFAFNPSPSPNPSQQQQQQPEFEDDFVEPPSAAVVASTAAAEFENPAEWMSLLA